MVPKKLREKLRNIIFLIERSGNVLILTHERPDGDAIGSSLALREALREKGKRTSVFIPDKVPQNLRFLPESEKIVQKVELSLFDLAIFLDSGNLRRSRMLERIKNARLTFINIDHHPQESPEGDISLVDSSFGATAEIIYYLLKEAKAKITKKIALFLLTGIFTDTGGFQHATTTPLSFKIASDLLLKGARLDKIARHTNQDKSLAALRIWGKAILRAKKDPVSKAISSFINKEDLERAGASLEDLSGVANLINSVSGAKFALLLTEYEKNRVKGTLRSSYFGGANVKRIAEIYGGGGHPFASGFEIKGQVKESQRGWKIIIKNK